MIAKQCNRRDFMKYLSAGTVTACAPVFSCTQPFPPLNFVFLLVDDMGWSDVGCYGSSFYETPNVDRLATEGMRFTDAYAACPVCSPTRASIMTGKYPERVKITNYIPGKKPGKLMPPEFLHNMPLEETTLAEAFKQAGYATCLTGKWHLGSEGYYPIDQGFDTNIVGCEYGNKNSYFPPYSRMYDGNSWSLRLEGDFDGKYLTDFLADESIKFIQTNSKKPFLLYHSFYTVHTPLQAKEADIKKYEEKAAKLPPHPGPRFIPEGHREARQVQDLPVYAAMVESMDTAVGRIMETLEELGVADNTAIIFMSDNGGLSTSEGSPTSNLPLRAGKGWMYEGGIREPMIVKWPGHTAPGSTCSEPVTSTDFYPTMLEMAGLSAMPAQHADGVSMVPLLTNSGSLDRNAIYWHYPHYGNQGGTPCGAVRAGDFKLIEFFEDNHVELYNLTEDIGEHNDLAQTMPDKVEELRANLHAWRASVDAAMPTPNLNYDPVADEASHKRQRERAHR
jgi:arylsulfatase A-like enzyme